MTTTPLQRSILLASVTTFATAALISLAQPVAAEDFYKGKTLKVIIRSGAGGGNDFYGRLLARHMPRHIPGNPGSIPVNMGGASGIIAANYIHNRAKRDGTEIGILARAIAVAQRTGVKGVRYDVRNLIPLGNPSSDTAIFVVSAKSKIKSLRDLKRGGPEIKVSTTGVTGGAYQRSMVLKHDGFPMRMITGYDSNSEKVLALVRGEVDITAGSFGTMQTDVREQNFRIVGKLGPNHPSIPAGTPDLRDIVTGDRKQLAAFLVAPLKVGRPFYIPPKVPADRVKILRTAFQKALADPQLLAEAKKAKFNITPMGPEPMIATNTAILNTSKDLVEKLKTLKGKVKLKTYKGAITTLEDRNKKVTMKRDNGKTFKTKLSGSRTTIMVAGKTVKRKALKVGMTCKITAPGNKKEAKKVDCK